MGTTEGRFFLVIQRYRTLWLSPWRRRNGRRKQGRGMGKEGRMNGGGGSTGKEEWEGAMSGQGFSSV